MQIKKIYWYCKKNNKNPRKSFFKIISKTIQLNNSLVDNQSLKRKYDNTKSENDSIIQINNSISSEKNTLKAKCSLLEKENKELVFVNNDLKEKNSSLTDRYTKLDESYNAMLKRNRKV